MILPILYTDIYIILPIMEIVFQQVTIIIYEKVL